MALDMLPPPMKVMRVWEDVFMGRLSLPPVSATPPREMPGAFGFVRARVITATQMPDWGQECVGFVTSGFRVMPVSDRTVSIRVLVESVTKRVLYPFGLAVQVLPG